MRRRWCLFYLLAVATMTSGLATCAQLVRPLQPGEAVVAKPGDGLIFGRIVMLRDKRNVFTELPRFNNEFGWELTQTASGKRYVISPLTQDGPFVLALPPGLYEVTKLMVEDRAGQWEGLLVASFVVKPGTLTYLGTWEIEFTNLGPSSKVRGRVVDQLNEARDDLQQTYGGTPQSITVGTLATAEEGYLSLLQPRAEQ